jgi:thioredoxin reductase/NAD-dependent dihydropyrimidine dehydrogenase PreA subunit
MIATYARWLHTRWPAGTVERLPASREDGMTAVPGVRIVGDLTGIPLLKFASDTGARAVRAILAEPAFHKSTDPTLLDLAIVGAGVAGISAAIEAARAGLRATVFEATQTFSTVVNFPKGKPIYTYPADMTPVGGLQFAAAVKEDLLAEMERQRVDARVEPVAARVERIERAGGDLLVHLADRHVVRAQRVVVAIGRSGNFRKLGCPGEDLDKVYNRLYDPREFCGKHALVVGGGDTALETAIALATAGAYVTLSYRKTDLARPKPENVEKLRRLERHPEAAVAVEHPTSERVTTATMASAPGRSAVGSVRLRLGTQVARVAPAEVVLVDTAKMTVTIPNDVVFTMIGRDAPLDFFRRSGIAIRGEWRPVTWLTFLAFLAFCVVLYHWKSAHEEFPLQRLATLHQAFPFNVPRAVDVVGGRVAEWANRRTNLLFTLKGDLGSPSFYYSLAYCTAVVMFGIRRIRRRPTPYVKWQTITLILMQCLPLFVLPELLPWIGRNGLFEQGHALRWAADHLFEAYDGGIGRERAYWRAYGFVLPFPLYVYNVFTSRPMWLWLVISALQTFVIIPLLVFRWGKGAYCGWLCSCGALAETLGDAHRQKMPHGPVWNRVNMMGQATLAFAVVILGLRIGGWSLGEASWAARGFHALFEGIPFLNYSWSVDIFLGGIIGVGLYFWFSGRVWCRFACPLAALMHVYARFSRFRIFPEKSKCISCNVCTSVCHQGIDVMNFANKGLPMEDPECVRCSACVQQCPTGVLSFGRYDRAGKILLDRLPASPVRASEGREVGMTREAPAFR